MLVHLTALTIVNPLTIWAEWAMHESGSPTGSADLSVFLIGEAFETVFVGVVGVNANFNAVVIICHAASQIKF